MFAHRGARAHARENTLEAFRLALKLGATGLESDVWVTADGVPVLDHDGEFGRFMRRTPISDVRRDQLPDHIPSLQDLLDDCGTGYHLSLDLKGEHCGQAVIDVVKGCAPELLARLWLCEPRFTDLLPLRELSDEVKLIDSTRLRHLDEGPERRAARLADCGIDGINMRNTDWNGGLVALFHRFELMSFVWDMQFEHHLRPAYRMGIDAVYSDHVDVMVGAFRAEFGSGPPGFDATVQSE